MENEMTEMAVDILRGAEAIACHLGFPRRLVYHLAANDNLPIFKLGATICARKTTLETWLAAKEARAA
jgi:hypothetical protein